MITNDPAAAIRLAGTEAVTCVALTYEVDSAVPLVPFQKITVPAEKPVPLTVKVNAGPPPVTVEGFTELTEGITGSWEAGFDVVPATVTVMDTGPDTTYRFAGTLAVTCVELTNVVDKAVPFQDTTTPGANALPFTVSVNPDPPAVTGRGLSELIVGGTPASVMLNGADEGWTKLIDVDCAGPVLADTV
jgi:hypothetical protein